MGRRLDGGTAVDDQIVPTLKEGRWKSPIRPIFFAHRRKGYNSAAVLQLEREREAMLAVSPFSLLLLPPLAVASTLPCEKEEQY